MSRMAADKKPNHCRPLTRPTFTAWILIRETGKPAGPVSEIRGQETLVPAIGRAM
jgi:hypothetical protein